MADDWTTSYDDQKQKTAAEQAQAGSASPSSGGDLSYASALPSGSGPTQASAPQASSASTYPAATSTPPPPSSAPAPAAPSTSVASDQFARGIYSSLQSAGHDVSWSGNQLMVDGRPYDVASGGMQGITDPSVSATVEPNGGSTSPGAGLSWAPGASQPTGAPAGMHWDASMANFEPDAPGASSTTKPSGGNPTDPTYAAQLVAYYANQPGANPSLKNDPNYWIQKLTSGELGSDENYIIGKFMTPEGAPAGSTGAGGQVQDFTASYQQPTLGTTPLPSTTLPSVSDPNANWNPSFSAPTVTAPTITPYAAPTAPWGASGPTSYKGGTADTSDIPNFTPDSVLAAEKNTPAAQGLDSLVTGLESSPGPLDQHTIDTLKAQEKDTLAEQQQFEDQNLKGMGGSLGIGDSAWLAAQRAAGMFSRDQSIASSNAAIDVDAAKSNYAAKQANAGIGQAYDSAKTAQYMQAVDAGLQRATVTGSREALQASIDQAAAQSGQTAQQIAATWIQHNVDASTAKELAAAGINLNVQQLQSANANHLMDLMVSVQQLKSSSSLQSQTANLNAALSKYGLDVNAALQMSAQQLAKYNIDNQTQLALIQLKQQNAQFAASYGLNAAGLQEQVNNDDWQHSYADTANL